jgi:hypothetical protein
VPDRRCQLHGIAVFLIATGKLATSEEDREGDLIGELVDVGATSQSD